jgi:quercetin dioxygenase-like cupin family protein
MKYVTAAGAVLGVCLVLPQAYADDAHPGHTMLTPDQMQWKDAAGLPPGTKVTVIEGPMNEAVPFTIRIKFPAGAKVPPHWHTQIEHTTVISGVFNLGVGDKVDASTVKSLPVGSAAFMQPKTTHFASFDEESIIQVHGVGPWTITYVNPADDPRKTN